MTIARRDDGSDDNRRLAKAWRTIAAFWAESARRLPGDSVVVIMPNGIARGLCSSITYADRNWTIALRCKMQRQLQWFHPPRLRKELWFGRDRRGAEERSLVACFLATGNEAGVFGHVQRKPPVKRYSRA